MLTYVSLGFVSEFHRQSFSNVTFSAKMKSVNRVDVWLLPVTHVNSNNTAWHLETRREKRKKRVGSRWSLRLRFPEEFAVRPPPKKTS